MQKINPFLWFNTEAEEAAKLYASTFKNGNVTSVNRNGNQVFIVTFSIAGLDFMAINGGPMYKPNQSISFFVHCETEEEVDSIWKNLSDGGTAIIPLDRYPFSEKYGWLQDRYGISWQISLSRRPQSIAPTLLFCGRNQGRAEEAVNFYLKEFPGSSLGHLVRYDAGDGGPTGQVKHSAFTLFGQEFMAMDSGRPMDVPFTPGLSLFLNCESQQEVDKYWDELSAEGHKDRCGWLQDSFGVSWQVIPTLLGRLMSSGDPKKSQNVMKAIMQMDKIVVADLQHAYDDVEAVA